MHEQLISSYSAIVLADLRGFWSGGVGAPPMNSNQLDHKLASGFPWLMGFLGSYGHQSTGNDGKIWTKWFENRYVSISKLAEMDFILVAIWGIIWKKIDTRIHFGCRLISNYQGIVTWGFKKPTELGFLF